MKYATKPEPNRGLLKFIGIIQRAIGFDLDFGGMQNQNALAEFILRLLDSAACFCDPPCSTRRDAEADRMIGECNHFDAALGGGLRHLQHRQLAIAPIGVDLQIGFDIFDFDQLGSLFCFAACTSPRSSRSSGGIHAKPSV